MLKNIRVLEFQGLAPSVFCGMYFVDQGADVIIIARNEAPPFSMPIDKNLMNRSKRCACLSLKSKQDRPYIIELLRTSSVIIDPYRPGVLEKLGLGPELIYKINPRAIMLRVSGYGQQGPMALKPGHDLNYLSKSGILPLVNDKSANIVEFPANYLADFVSSSLGITATLSALKISRQTGKGRIVDCSLSSGCSYLAKVFMEEGLPDRQKVSYRTCGSKQFCITSNSSIAEKQMDQTIRAMIRNGQQYFQSSGLQISMINGIPKLEDQLLKLKNPFDRDFQPKRDKLVERGENTEQIKRLAIPRSKL